MNLCMNFHASVMFSELNTASLQQMFTLGKNDISQNAKSHKMKEAQLRKKQKKICIYIVI